MSLGKKLFGIAQKICHVLAKAALFVIYAAAFPLAWLLAYLFQRELLENPNKPKNDSYWVKIDAKEEFGEISRQF